MPVTEPQSPQPPRALLDVFGVFLRLGLTSFGGPIAHIAFFRTEFVEKRRWLDEKSFADTLALCQFLPGPASSQLGAAIGYCRAGFSGGLAAWLGFTLPSAALMIAFALGLARAGDLSAAPWLHGLKIVAVAVVAQAVWTMAESLCPDRARATLAVAAACLSLAHPSALGQIAAIVIGGLYGRWFLRRAVTPVLVAPPVAPSSRNKAAFAAALFVALLAGLPLLAQVTQNHSIALFESFYRSGALVFGGGHVVLPLLRQAVVATGWIGDDSFLAGYGAAQALPGPLFAFAAYLGAAMSQAPNGVASGLLCLVAIYLPSLLLLVAVLPFWDMLRRRPEIQAALAGINAAVVGLLVAAFFNPVWTSAILSPADFSLALAAFLLLVAWKAPPWLVVALGAAAKTAWP